MFEKGVEIDAEAGGDDALADVALSGLERVNVTVVSDWYREPRVVDELEVVAGLLASMSDRGSEVLAEAGEEALWVGERLYEPGEDEDVILLGWPKGPVGIVEDASLGEEGVAESPESILQSTRRLEEDLKERTRSFTGSVGGASERKLVEV